MRTFIRHPSDVPIEIQLENWNTQNEQFLNNVSAGGLSFRSFILLEENAVIRIRISMVKPMFEARARVVWCRKENEHFDVGIEFVDLQDLFRARMIEQICRIEHYKKEMYEKEGRELSGREAALEWITKYAGSFHDENLEIAEQKS